MKTTMITVAALTAATIFATTAFAADFDNTATNLVLERDNLTFGIESVSGEATAMSVGIAVLPHSVLDADADLTLGVKYAIQDEDLTFTAAYGLSKHYGQVNVYGTAEAAYTIVSGASEGEWDATPTVGASYAVNEQLAAFSEVSYTWNATNDWAAEGGALEVGARYELSDNVSVTPSLVRSFDTAADETNVKVELGLRF